MIARLYGERRARALIGRVLRRRALDPGVWFEEARQRTALRLIEGSAIAGLQEAEGWDRAVMVAASHAALSIAREHAARKDELAGVADALEELRGDDPWPDTMQRIDAREAARRLLALQGAAPAQGEGTQPSLVRRLPRAPTASDRAGAAELAAIRERLALTVPELADALGLPQPRLASYLYGRVQRIPRAVLEAARALEQRTAPCTQAVDEPMRALLKGWAARLGFERVPQDRAGRIALAGRLGVDRTTLGRWLSGRVRPSPAQVRRLNERVAHGA